MSYKHTEDQFSVCTPEEESFFQEMDAKKAREEEAKLLKQGWYRFKLKGQKEWQCAFWDAEFECWDAPTYVSNVNQWKEDWVIGDRVVMPGEENYGN